MIQNNTRLLAIQTKIVKGKEYLYFTHYSNGKKTETYCGLASDKQSKKKALQFELDHLKEQKKRLSQKIVEIETNLK